MSFPLYLYIVYPVLPVSRSVFYDMGPKDDVVFSLNIACEYCELYLRGSKLNTFYSLAQSSHEPSL